MIKYLLTTFILFPFFSICTCIYKGWGKSQHLITDTNKIHLTGYLKNVIDDAIAYQIYIQSRAGGNDTVNNQYGRISPCGDCHGSGSSTDSCRIDNHRHPIIDPTVAATAPSPQCRIKVKKHTVPHYYNAMKIISNHICMPNVGAHDNNSLRPRHWVHHMQATFQKHEDCCALLNTSESNQGPINGIPSLTRMMAWNRTGSTPLFEPMLTLNGDAYNSTALVQW